jgi:hypothetical protein
MTDHKAEPRSQVQFDVVAGFVNHAFISNQTADEGARIRNGQSTFTKLYLALNWTRGAFAFSPLWSIAQP